MSSIMLYICETWTIEGQKRIKAFAMWCYGRMLRIINEVVLNKKIVKMITIEMFDKNTIMSGLAI